MGGNGVVALADILGAVNGDTADLNLRRDLVKQIGQNRRISDVAASNLDGSDLERFLVDSDLDLAPYSTFGAAMLAGVPVALNLDPGAVEQQVQRPFGAAIRDIHGEGLLAAGQHAEVGRRTVEVDQAQQTLDETRRLSERQTEQHLYQKAGLDGVRRENSPLDCFLVLLTAVVLLATGLAVGTASQLILGSNQIVSEPRRLSASL